MMALCSASMFPPTLLAETPAPPSQPSLTAVGATALWITFNVIVALIPLAVSPLLSDLTGARIKYNWELLRDGELFFFSSTLTAAAIGKLVELSIREGVLINPLTFAGLIVTLLFSAICFGASVVKKRSPEIAPTGTTAPPGGLKLAKTSAVVAVLAAICSFVAFYQGGFK